MSRVVHFEIHAEDPPAAARFYETVFGWRITKVPIPNVEYWVIATGEGPGIDGGIVQRMGAHADEGAPVNGYVCAVGIDNLDATFEKAMANGAAVALAKFAVPGVGWVAYIKDPAGNILGLQQADPGAA
jgi:uncharacterized protein